MSFLKNLFKNKNKEQLTNDCQEIQVEKRKLSINELQFEKMPNEEIERIWEMMSTGKISGEEHAKIRREMLDKCKMTILAENGIKLYRMAKSSEEIAQKSAECWRQIKHQPNSVVVGNENGHGMSLTTANKLILCIPYGDMVTEVVFDNARLKENGMENHFVYKVGQLFDEYLATKILTGDMWSISNPEVLKMVIDMSSNDALEIALKTPINNKNSINSALYKFGFNNTLTYWEKIQDRYHELNKINDKASINQLRTELGDLLYNTPLVGNNMFNNGEPVDLTTSIDEKDKEI